MPNNDVIDKMPITFLVDKKNLRERVRLNEQGVIIDINFTRTKSIPKDKKEVSFQKGIISTIQDQKDNTDYLPANHQAEVIAQHKTITINKNIKAKINKGSITSNDISSLQSHRLKKKINHPLFSINTQKKTGVTTDQLLNIKKDHNPLASPQNLNCENQVFRLSSQLAGEFYNIIDSFVGAITLASTTFDAVANYAVFFAIILINYAKPNVNRYFLKNVIESTPYELHSLTNELAASLRAELTILQNQRLPSATYAQEIDVYVRADRLSVMQAEQLKSRYAQGLDNTVLQPAYSITFDLLQEMLKKLHAQQVDEKERMRNMEKCAETLVSYHALTAGGYILTHEKLHITQRPDYQYEIMLRQLVKLKKETLVDNNAIKIRKLNIFFTKLESCSIPNYSRHLRQLYPRFNPENDESSPSSTSLNVDKTPDRTPLACLASHQSPQQNTSPKNRGTIFVQTNDKKTIPVSLEINRMNQPSLMR